MSNSAPRLNETVNRFDKPKRHVDRCFIHCSAASRESIDAAEIHLWHTRDNGWSAIGYHYFIKTDGTLQYGRDLEITPAAQSGHNTGSIAICLNGLNDPPDFKPEQLETLRWICDEINAAYDKITFHGHCEVSAKACPVITYRDILNLDNNGYMGESSGAPLVTESPIESVSFHKMKINRTVVCKNISTYHFDVAIAQGLLHAHGFGNYVGAVDGFAGPKFDDACKRFQRKHGLQVDGVVGPDTWELLEDAGN